MNSWNGKEAFTTNNVNPVDGILDNFCSISEPDDSGHFTASPEAGGRGESLVELVEIPSSPPKAQKFCDAAEGNYEFDDDGCMSSMSAPGVLRGITRRLEKSPNSPNYSDSDDTIQVSKNASKECTYPNTYLGDVLKDFNSMFKEKLDYIDNATKHADIRTKILMMERRNDVLEQWAKDVCSQNMLLVHTVEELEEEANRKVKTLQGKISATTNLARSHMEMIQQYEKQVEELLNEQSVAQQKYEILTYEHMEVNKSYKTMQQRTKSLENDNDSLRSLICRIRDMGVWDTNGLQLQPSTYDLLFGLYPNLAGSEVQTVFTREKARHIFDTEMKSKEMETFITELKDAKRNTIAALDEKEKTVVTLEAEVKSLSTVLKHYETQYDDLKKALEETQDKLLQVTSSSNLSTVETREELTSAMSRRDQDVKDMLNELRELKTQLNKACDERQSAIYEAKMLKQELGDRTSEMLEMRNILQIIQNEAECTRSAVQNVQEKQDHLSILKNQVQSYQEKYEQAQTLLSSKSEIIQSLQQQMSMLHEKIYSLEDEWDKTIAKVSKRSSAFEDTYLEEPTVITNSTMNGDSDQDLTNGHDNISEENTDVEHEFVLVNGNNNIVQLDKTLALESSVVCKLREEFNMEKTAMEKSHLDELRNRDIEITMQKVTIQHLQDALVALKRGQSIPPPSMRNGKVFHI